jgi:putative ABC transport system permease protein
MATGKMWEKPFEVSIGNTVAQAKNLQVGDTFYSAHGLVENAIETHEHHPFTVVGIFKPSNSVLDQLILTPVESIWQVHQHEGEHAHEHANTHEHLDTHEHEGEHTHGHLDTHEHAHNAQQEATVHAHPSPKASTGSNKSLPKSKKLPLAELGEDDDSKSITALFVQFRSPLGMMTVPRKVNEDTSMQAAVPAVEVNRLFGLMGFGMNTLRGIALVIMLIAAISVFISLYNSLKDRQYEMALMRSMGASPGTLFAMVMQESMLLSLIGFALGLLLSRIGLGLLAGMLEESFHYSFNIWQFLPQEGLLFALTLVIGFVAALLPAIQASRTNISKTLAHA